MALQYLGLRKTSLIDFPGRLAAVVFTHGCPLRCPFCHNPELVQGPLPESFLPAAEVLAFLRKRANLLSGVVISGGEPLLHADLPQLITKIGALGLGVKVDTSGALPQSLAEILRLEAVTYVAMDIKTAPGRYPELGVEWAP
ncbi:MAG: anaerobic ribonucleoside-triphosphate reductase activating protein, partial [Spirochaetaceae bacterium]